MLTNKDNVCLRFGNLILKLVLARSSIHHKQKHYIISFVINRSTSIINVMGQIVAFTFGKGVANLYRTLKRTRPDILILLTDNDDDCTDYGLNYSLIIELEDIDVVEGSVLNQPAPL